MTTIHHPSDEALVSFAAGALDEAHTLVVALHLGQCQRCRGAYRTFACVGGHILSNIEPLAMKPNATERALASIALPADNDDIPSKPTNEDKDPLSLYPIGRWRWIGRGVYWRPIPTGVTKGESRAIMLKAAGGTVVPHHGHVGTEWTCVLEGAFRHEHGRFGPGDFDQADDAIDHHPVIEAGPPCVCVVALSGHVAFKGWVGRLLQPLVRI